jgi:2-C-methyl-D-erythritol 4-phosphate cytidylyltransferase
MKKYAVIVAGGSGQRMGSSLPKQFLLLKEKPLLQHTVQSFLNAYRDINVILVLPAAHIEKGHEIIKQMQAEAQVQIVPGGETRFASVKNGLGYVSHPSIVFVHDGVRCLVSQQLIYNCFKQAVEKGSAIPSVCATDSIRIDEGNSHFTIDRNKVRIIQTPQTFQSEILADAFKQSDHPSFTDEATVVEASGKEVFLIEGDYNNLKITRPLYLYIDEKLLEKTIS